MASRPMETALHCWGILCLVLVALVGSGPTYLQLYRGLRDAITGGVWSIGAVLPSTRQLADELELSRNTVLRAYEQLIAEGYAIARPGGGTFVAKNRVDDHGVARRIEPSPIELGPQGLRIASSMVQNPFLAMAELAPVPYDFMFGVPDPAIFPIHDWRKVMSRTIERASKRTLGYDNPMGVPRLRKLVATHLGKHRGVRCNADQIVIASGTQQALDLLARLLLQPGDPVLVEDPCYPATRATLTAAGAQMVRAPVDADGINLEGADRELLDRCRLAYVTPSHQFPTGAVMSTPRRRALLEWATRTGSTIVEDDYDGDYRHAGPPLQALQGMDSSGRVVYVGTFSKSLFPSLRLAYVVAPPSLVSPLTAAKWIADWGSPALLQHALAEFMEAGHFARHLKRSSAIYIRRRDVLLAALKRELGEGAVVLGADAGMHIVLCFPELTARALEVVVTRARALGVGVYLESAFYERAPSRTGLVLGYSGLSEKQIPEGIALLAQAIQG